MQPVWAIEIGKVAHIPRNTNSNQKIVGKLAKFPMIIFLDSRLLESQNHQILRK
jgi:hypothetical protein